MSRIMLAAWLLCGICLAGPVHGADDEKNSKAEGPAVSAAQGIMVGEVTDTTAIVQVRLTKSDTAVDGKYPGVPGKVRFILTNFDIQLKPTQRDIEIGMDLTALIEAAYTSVETGQAVRLDDLAGAEG